MVTDERSETCDVDDVDGTSDALSMNQKDGIRYKNDLLRRSSLLAAVVGGMMAEEQKIDLKLTRWQ